MGTRNSTSILEPTAVYARSEQPGVSAFETSSARARQPSVVIQPCNHAELRRWFTARRHVGVRRRPPAVVQRAGAPRYPAQHQLLRSCFGGRHGR